MQPNKQGHSLTIVVSILIIITLSTAAVFTYRQGKQNNKAELPQENQDKVTTVINTPLAPYILIYGGWTEKGSTIKSIDLSSGEYKTIAELPSTIKKVSVLSNDKLLYIDKTDERDHGEQLATYTISTGISKPLFTAANGFGIDDYVISPNKEYIATWEVAFAQGAPILKGGKSRVYTATIANPSQKNLLYDETVTAPIHYPRAILNDGKVFLDTFLPNDPNGGTGWAYGMSMTSFEGKHKQNIDTMKNGTYGTQPVLSPDGRKLAFAGYDGSLGSGTNIKNGFRQAVLNPNTVEVLDTTTLTRQKIALPTTNTYASILWNKTNGELLYSAISKNPAQSGTYQYDFAAQSAKKVDLLANNPNASLVSALSADTFLIGQAEHTLSTIANLGDTYTVSFNQLSVNNIATEQITQLNLPDFLMQYITIVPSNYFASGQTSVQSEKSGAPTVIDFSSKKSTARTNMQLATFFLKPNLGPTRDNQQSEIISAQNALGVFAGLPLGLGGGLPGGAGLAGGLPGIGGGTAGPNTGGSPSSGGSPVPGAGLPGIPKNLKASDITASQSGNPSSPGAPSSDCGVPQGAPKPYDCDINIPGQPKCRELAIAQCESQGYKNDGSTEFLMCWANLSYQYSMSGTCFDSPLYLYGEEGTQVHVTINTPVYAAVPSYKDGYDVTIAANNKLLIRGNSYDSIAYDYTPALKKIVSPTHGAIVPRAQVSRVLREYGNKLGLNEKEINDLIAAGQQKITSPFVFISFFEHKTSQEILPLSFSPEPDNFLNVVFYFKQLKKAPVYTPAPPIFGEPLDRSGITAVEVSELVE